MTAELHHRQTQPQPIGPVRYVRSMPYTVDPAIPAGTLASATQPTLRIDDELSARPFLLADADAVKRAFDDPDISFWHSFRTDNLDEAARWINRTHELWIEEKSAGWAITDQADEVLGRCALHIDMRRGAAEVAYWVLPEARRRSVAARSAIALTAWAHDSLGVHRVLLQHSTQNLASCAVAHRAGFTAEGTNREQELHDDGWHDMHQHAHIAGD